jgi:hypothetical protein
MKIGRRGNTFITFLKKRRKRDCRNAINSIYFRIFGGDYTRRPRRICESHWKKMIGKPCAGKLHARFDEGELEIAPYGYYASSLLYPRTTPFCNWWVNLNVA